MDQHFRPCNHPTASRYIRSFWQMQGEPIYQTETILPKGVVELIFSFDEPLLFHPGQPTKHVPTPRCFINGINQEPVQLATPEKQFFFGIMLRPVAVKKLLKAPAGVFANAIINLEEVQKEFAELWHLLAEAADFKAASAWQKTGSIQDKKRSTRRNLRFPITCTIHWKPAVLQAWQNSFVIRAGN